MMKYICAFIFLLTCFSYHSAARFFAPVQTRNMKPTIYDDGKSCPGNCDAHVVFHLNHNGTGNAFLPSSSRSNPRKCVPGGECRICFSREEASCMLALYRGGGPSPGRFDFTPAFYEENCPKSGLPAAFAAICRSAQPGINRLKNQINCVADPEHANCRTLMTSAARRKAADDALYESCKNSGEAAFNRKYRNQPRMQRSNDCAYEKFGTGRNSRGQTWKRLLDGACRAGTYAGRDGLDCCTGSLYAAALLGRECRGFFVSR